MRRRRISAENFLSACITYKGRGLRRRWLPSKPQLFSYAFGTVRSPEILIKFYRGFGVIVPGSVKIVCDGRRRSRRQFAHPALCHKLGGAPALFADRREEVGLFKRGHSLPKISAPRVAYRFEAVEDRAAMAAARAFKEGDAVSYIAGGELPVAEVERGVRRVRAEMAASPEEPRRQRSMQYSNRVSANELSPRHWRISPM